MRYITGIHALNLMCSLDTPGDWHQSALNWENLKFSESENSFFGDYGLEENSNVPENTGTFLVANHIRALLDLLIEGKFGYAQGMNNDFICNPKYNDEVFSMVIKLKVLPHWKEIDRFMGKEYYSKWLRYVRQVS